MNREAIELFLMICALVVLGITTQSYTSIAVVGVGVLIWYRSKKHA